MTITNLNILQSGTVATVAPLNENFETIRVSINTIEQTEITNKTFLENKITEVKNSSKEIISAGEVFCINNGPTTIDGAADILSFSGATLTFKTPFSGTNIDGERFEITTLANKTLSGYANGTYNIFVDKDGEIEILNNTIYRQIKQPTNTINNIWLDISQVPLKAKRYTSSGWETFLKVPIGSITISNSNITKAITFTYNQNGYNFNKVTMPHVLFPPNYSKGVNKANDITYTAETYGWLYIYYLGYSTNDSAKLTIDGKEFTISYVQFLGSAYGCGASTFIPINKGSTYKATKSTTFIFYPSTTY